MIDFLNTKYNLSLEYKDNLQWNQCGYSEDIGIITRIGFYGLSINEFPIEIFNMKELEMLSLVNNDLKSIPPDVRKLSSLKELYIGGNMLVAMPDELGDLISLKYLYIIEENLNSIPSTLENLDNLEELIITTSNHNRIIEIIKDNNIKSKKIIINSIEL